VRVLKRADVVWRTRGARGFGRFVASRLFSHRRDIVFEADTVDDPAATAWTGPGTLLCVTRANADRLLTTPLIAQLAQGEGAEYVDGLHHDDMLLAVVDGAGNVLHHSYMLFRTRTKRLLGEGPDVPLFAHCATQAQARGQRIYPRVLRHGLAILARAGHRRAIINCEPSNRASVSGIEHAGFRRTRELRTWSLFSFVGVQVGRDREGRRILRLYWG
jgi:hypothetical protein